MSGKLKVTDPFRTNELSLLPGGKTVTITHNDGREFIYDKIKNPDRYIRNIFLYSEDKDTIIRVAVNGKTVWNLESGAKAIEFFK